MRNFTADFEMHVEQGKKRTTIYGTGLRTTGVSHTRNA